MRVRLLSFVATVAMAAACNAGKDNPKGGSGGKGSAAAPTSKAARIASEVKARGFYLEEAGATSDADATAAAAGTADDSQTQVGAQEIEDLLRNEAQGGDTAGQAPTQQQATTGQQAPTQQGQATGGGQQAPTQQGQSTGGTGAEAPTQQVAGQGQVGQPQGLPPPIQGQCIECGGGGDQGEIFGKPHVSRFEVTILSRADQSPIVGAKLAIKRMHNRGKKGFVEMDSFSQQAKRTNKFIVYVASGRHYSLAASAKGYDLLLKELNINAKGPVDVQFPVMLDDEGSMMPGGDDGLPPDPQQPPQPIGYDPQEPQQAWQWCMQNSDGGQQGFPTISESQLGSSGQGQGQGGQAPVQLQGQGQGQGQVKQQGQKQGMGLADIASQQQSNMQQKVDVLGQMLKQVPQDQPAQEAQQVIQKMTQDGYQPVSFGCGPDKMRIKWRKNKDVVNQNVPQTQLQQQFPLGPDQQQKPIASQPQITQPELQAPSQQPQVTQSQDPAQQPQVTQPQLQAPAQQAEGLLACNREATDFSDVYMFISEAKMADVIKQLKAKVKSGAHFQTCAASRPSVTFGFTDGSTLQFDASAINDDYWM